jgi:uncharacterized protein YggE
MERTIRVTGSGKISVKPDMIRLNINLEDVRETYEATLEQSTIQVEMLKDCFEKLGFAHSDLKTLRFNVDTEYESYRDERDVWQRKFVGYKFEHSLKIEFDADNKRLGQVLYALAHAPIRPEFRISYTVKDPASAKNQLLGKAIADSKEKAKVLTEAAGVQLGDIVTIDYSWGEVEFISHPMEKCMSLAEDCCMAAPSAYDIDIEPDDIDMSDTVTVVWRIS